MDIASLREQIDRKHQEAIRALETIAGYLTEAPSNPITDQRPKSIQLAHGGGKGTRVDRVMAALATEAYKTVEQIEEETKLPDYAVRAVLYSKFVKPKVVSKKIDKRVAFRLKSSSSKQASNGEEKSVAAMVRDLLSEHPDGLSAAAINAALCDEVERRNGNKAAIGAALYNGKDRGKLLHDEKAGLYSLVAAAAGQ